MKEATIYDISNELQVGPLIESRAKVMQMDNPPDADLAASDLLALGALNYLKRNGHLIPDEIGVAGFGNEPLTEMITPSLTTLEQFGVDMGKSTSELLLNNIEGSKQSVTMLTQTQPKLIIRESSSRLRSLKSMK
ncbi:MAG: substrate-binding domain-containing protein [Marinoscillum sp.]